MPTFMHGKNSAIYFGAYDVSTYLRSTGINRQTDTGETTAFQSTNKTYVLGTIGGTAEMEGMFSYNPAAKEFAEIMEDYAALEAFIPWAVSLGATTITAGTVMQAGLCMETNVSYSGSVSDIVGVSVSLQLTDTAGRTLALQNPATVVACTGVTQAGTEVDYSAFRVPDADAGGPDTANLNFPKGGVACIHVLQNTVNAPTVMAIQSRDGAAAYADIGGTNSIPAATIGYYSQSVKVPVEDGIRWNIVSTGTGNLRFLAYFLPTVAMS